MKLRWMLDHVPEVRQAHEEDDLLFGTVESWIVYVCILFCQAEFLSIYAHI